MNYSEEEGEYNAQKENKKENREREKYKGEIDR